MSRREPGAEDPGAARGRQVRRGAAAYQGALEAVLAIAIGALLGYWVDGRLGSSPRWLIVGTIVGFGAFTLRLFRMRKLFDVPPGEGDRKDP
jgi:F0F1-type ATP synthase assembly protein I